MNLGELVNQIMPKLNKLLDKINDDRLLSISIDEAWDNGIILTFQVYNGCDYTDETYQMRAIIGEKRIIYENAINGVELRDFNEEFGISIKEYDEIMNI